MEGQDLPAPSSPVAYVFGKASLRGEHSLKRLDVVILTDRKYELDTRIAYLRMSVGTIECPGNG